MSTSKPDRAQAAAKLITTLVDPRELLAPTTVTTRAVDLVSNLRSPSA